MLDKGNCRRSTRQSSRPLIDTGLPNYGTGGDSSQTKGTLLEFTKDMDQIFPPVSNVDSVAEKASSVQELSSQCRSQKATAKQKLMDSFGLDLNSNMFSKEKVEETGAAAPYDEAQEQGVSGDLRAREELQVKSLRTCQQNSCAVSHCHNAGDGLSM